MLRCPLQLCTGTFLKRNEPIREKHSLDALTKEFSAGRILSHGLKIFVSQFRGNLVQYF